jgi:hypothetical protein
MKPKRKLPPWGRHGNPPGALLVGVGWYLQDDWTRVKAAAVDAERFEATYAEWVEIAERALSDLRAAGVAGQKSYVKASELLAWCLAHDKPNDAAARAEFVSEQTRRSHDDSARDGAQTRRRPARP